MHALSLIGGNSIIFTGVADLPILLLPPSLIYFTRKSTRMTESNVAIVDERLGYAFVNFLNIIFYVFSIKRLLLLIIIERIIFNRI